MSLFQIAADACKGLGPLVGLAKDLWKYLLWIIPILLIILVSMDLGKAVIAGDEKEVKAAQSRLIKRLIYGVAVFFVVLIVTLVFNVVADRIDTSNGGNWLKCWNSIK